MESTLTSSQIFAAATKSLLEGGYQAVGTALQVPGSTSSRMFEDPHGIVLISVFDSWSDLANDWTSAQGYLVDEITKYLGRPEPKAWEGYLVLLTSGVVPDEMKPELNRIRYDTSRVRKLAATGSELQTLEDVTRSLLPLLPLEISQALRSTTGILDRLPDLLERQGIGRDVTATIVDAFSDNESMLDALHRMRLA